MLRSVFFDTETTGLSPKTDRIVEIAAFDATMNKTFTTLVNPQIPIPKETTAIHNITDEMVKDAPTFVEAGQQFIDFCKDDCVLIAHNGEAFDRFFIEEEFKRHSLINYNWILLDTLKWARKYRNDLPRHSMQYLREIYAIPPNQAHRALDDVIILHKLFSKMIGDLTIEQVISLLYGEKPIKISNYSELLAKS
jgi:DNA polymerase III subunit epsilon